MSDKQFISNLSATYVDVRKLDAKIINLKGKNILEYLENNNTVIKHAQDTRETVTENDLWGQWIETLDDGTVIIHDDWVTNPNSGSAWNWKITKVEDNKAYVGDTLYGNIQTEKIKDGRSFFYLDSALTSFVGDLNNLEIGGGTSMCDGMFAGCAKLTTFTSDLSSLENGYNMFYDCRNLATFSSDLPCLTDGNHMFSSCINLTTFSSDLPCLTHGGKMFYYCPKLTTFSSDLSNLTEGSWMFYDCTNLKTFSSDLSNLTDSRYMFSYCNTLTTFSSDLSNLTDSRYMFSYCTNLKTFSSNLPSLTAAHSMFYLCTALTSFSSDLRSLTNGYYMFNNCTNLESFNSDLSSLTDGNHMFNCCANLTTFKSDLSNLTDGNMMFYFCSLDAQSVMYIIHSIKDITAEKQLYSNDSTPGTIPYVTLSNGVYSAPKGFMSDGRYVYTYNNPQPYTTTISASDVGKLTIGIDVTNNANTISQQLQTFAEGTLFDSWADLKQAFVDKGWTVTWQYGETYESITYDLRGGERIIPCPVYTKLIEILPEGIELDEEGNEVGEKFYTDEQKNFARYCNEDGTKFYNIDWGHDVTNYDDYQQFDSLETACVSYGVMPKEYLETNGQPTLF